MLSLLNKSAGEKAAAQVLPWRPDFRDASQLPDTKTVRTNFFVNILAAGLTGALALFVAQREWALLGLRQSLADVETRIASTAPASAKAQAAYAHFQAEEAKFNEAAALVRDSFRFSDLVLHLGEVLPPGASLRRIEFRAPGQSVLVTGAVRGLDAAASDVASNLVKQLQSDQALAVHFASIELTNLGRNAEEGSLNFELVFTFKGAAKGGVKK